MIRNTSIQEFPLAPFKIDHTDEGASEALSSEIVRRIKHCGAPSEIVMLCIGTDRSTGDALGPLVGTRLQRLYPPNIRIYGTIDEPVHAVNLSKTMEWVEKVHPSSLIIAVDACLGQFHSVGYVTVAHGPLKPGSGVKKELPEVGSFHITGTVNIGGFMEYLVLQNTRLSIVMKMADTIADAVYLSCRKITGHISM